MEGEDYVEILHTSAPSCTKANIILKSVFVPSSLLILSVVYLCQYLLKSVSQDRNRWQALVRMVVKLWVTYYLGNFVTS
jgi:predicted DNA-binding helix-hairpin-helix protein